MRGQPVEFAYLRSMPLAVIGAGLPRTGTASLKQALEQLGLADCYHMRVLMENKADRRYWAHAMAGQPVDWDELFRGYQAAVDFPACVFYQELMEHYPMSKVILSLRDPEKWYESCLHTIHPLIEKRRAESGASKKLKPDSLDRFRPEDLWDRLFQGRFEDKAHTLTLYNNHNEEVRRVVPRDRLLVYDPAEGWDPLCRFLDLSAPADTPFPHVNKRDDFWQWVASRRKAYRARMRKKTLRNIAARVRHQVGRLVRPLWKEET